VKKIITIFISLLTYEAFCLLPVFAQENCLAKVTTKFESANCISCKVEIPALKIKSNASRNTAGYESVTSAGCEQSVEVGQPSLPMRSFFVLLPPEAEVKDVVITSVETITLRGEYNLKPVSPPIPVPKDNRQTIDNQTTDSQDGCPTTSYPISQDEDYYPKNIVQLNPTQRLRGYSLACVSVFGACYNPKTKQLVWNKQVNFKLNLTSSKTKAVNPALRGIKEDEELVKGLVVNPEIISTYTMAKRQIPLVTYNYVVITNEDLATAFEQLCASKPMTTKIITTSWIYTNYTGVDNQEKIRTFIKDYYGTYGTRYVLLGGDVDIVPYRGVYAKVSEGGPNLRDYIDSNIPCDLYYACLDGNWNADNDNIYGELDGDEVDLLPEIWVGRAPVSTLKEATNFVNKVIACENSQDDYFYKELLIAYILYNEPPYFCDGKEIMEDIARITPATYTVYKEYETEGGVSNSTIINHINSGVGLIAHANHTNWDSAPPFNIGDDIDVKTLGNGSKTFIFNTIGCDAGDFSQPDCIGEKMLLNPSGGAVAFIGNSRYGWFDETDVTKYSGEYQIEFFKKFFKEGYTRIGETLGRSKIEFTSRCDKHNPYRWIMFCLNLLGDPAMEFRAQKEIFYIDHTIEEVIDKPGTITDLIVTLKNLTGGTITGVIGTLTTTDPYLTIIKGTANFGDMPFRGTATNSSNPYQIMVTPDCPSIHQAYFKLEISGNEGGYKNTDNFSVLINLKVDNLRQVFPYPNPCYPGKGQFVTIANIPLNSHPEVYIYNIAGELVRKLDEEGSEIKVFPGCEQVIWDTKNDKDKNVASGIYIYILKCDAGAKKGKIAIIR